MEFKTMIIREGFLVNRELISKITKIPLGNVRLPRTSDKRPSYEDISHGVCGKKVAWNEGKFSTNVISVALMAFRKLDTKESFLLMLLVLRCYIKRQGKKR
ncbi:uncharacterized protein LOC113330729 [Papaver somniferum]|uniref:uncharacterized protein LOC113330729 n=1 Tax=Papaver somniferum TaxID=3469 RepID=UPI000E7019E8|nr:uncharacterized protein LOC113330729 [Papaver somniferum]